MGTGSLTPAPMAILLSSLLHLAEVEIFVDWHLVVVHLVVVHLLESGGELSLARD